jgi:hypothetical protein
MRPKLSYANVISTLCLFLLFGGSAAYAASQLGKNSVGTKQLKKNSVTTAKIKKNAVTGAKVKEQTLTGSDINLGKLGTVPSANVANTANTLAPPEAVHLVGAPNEPGFQGGSSNVGSAGSFRLQSAGFYKDHEGIVHLQGFVKIGAGAGPIFTLPPGYRPSSGTLLLFEPLDQDPVQIAGSNTSIGGSDFGGAVLGAPAAKAESLDGITFRAES